MTDSVSEKWVDQQVNATTKALERGTESNIYINATHGLAVFTTIIMTTIGALAIINQELTIGGLIAANMLASRIVSPLGQLVGTWKNIINLEKSIQRLHSVFRQPGDKQEYSIELPKPKGEIIFENVSFSYLNKGPPVLRDISLAIPPLNMTGIIGHNGSGKSTLIKILMGLYPPDTGRLTIDDIDVNQLSRQNISNWIGYVPQETVLFDGTIRDNISLTYDAATDQEIIAAAEISGAHQMIVNLPNGYDTTVGESGSSLSGGMRQRISIARALVKNPDIIVMDEPSANLDEDAEQNLCHSLLSLTSKKTLVLITHSKSILQICASIIVIQAGKVKEIRHNPKSKTEILEMLKKDKARKIYV
jgi:ABC-type bacteriocin/lantibiotic exporter with double-glycine peptidase domain